MLYRFISILALIGVARYYDNQGLYERAKPWFTDCVQATCSRFGEAHLAVATSFNLAELYRSQGRYEAAEPLCLEMLPILFEQLGEDHPNTKAGWRNFVSFLVQVVQENRTSELSKHPLTQQLAAQIQASSNEAQENAR